MRVVVQRTTGASVSVEGKTIGRIGEGLVILVGFTNEDTEEDVTYMVEKVAHLRIFEDASGKMNESVLEKEGEILLVSQFTLYGDCRKGRRPSFTAAARPEVAEPLYGKFNQTLREKGLSVKTGRFGASMEVSLVNDGPVTLILETPISGVPKHGKKDGQNLSYKRRTGENG